MSRRPRGSVTLTPTVPRDLAELYATHAAPLSLPLPSHLLAAAMRATLAAAGIDPPPLPPPTRTHAATLARARRRQDRRGT